MSNSAIRKQRRHRPFNCSWDICFNNYISWLRESFTTFQRERKKQYRQQSLLISDKMKKNNSGNTKTLMFIDIIFIFICHHSGVAQVVCSGEM